MPQHLPSRLLTAAAALLLVSACGGNSSPDPSPSPAVSPVPSTVAIDLALADRLYVEGDIDRAVGIYSAAALRGTEQEQRQGLWALARIQYEQGAQKDAAQNTAALLATEPEDEEQERRAYLLLGYAEMAQGHPEEAKEALEKYIRLGGPATPYAQAKLAEIASAEDHPEDAVRGARQALAAELPPAQGTALMFSLARYQEDAEDIEGALVTLATLGNEGETADDQAEALWETARIAGEMGDGQRRQDALRTLIVSYPSSDKALEALVPSEQTTIPERALVLYRHRENEAATQAYRSLLADPDAVVVGEAHYRLGILAERSGDPVAAIGEYGAAIAVLTSTGGALLDDAYWDRGLALETVGRLDEAVADYAALAGLAGSDHAADALMRAGMIRFRQGLPVDAATFWERRLGLVDGHEAARTHFWLARAYELNADINRSIASLAAARDSSPLGYYGLRATALLGAEAPVQDPQALQAAPLDWGAVEAWLQTLVGAEPTSTATPDAAFNASPAWLRAEEVMEAGLVDEAIDELRSVIVGEDSAWVLYRMARRMSDEGYVRTAALAASSLLGYENPPTALLSLSYPAKYVAHVNAAAQGENVSPLLLLALVRQESFFDVGAVSVAGALGLTQVMPDTGRQIAGELAITDFKEGDLLEAETSLRFGAHYLAAQLSGFGGNVGAALAAYNGGPGNAARWTEAAGDDIDMLVETIDFDETRLYVETVLENLALYRYVYGVTDTPSLPLN